MKKAINIEKVIKLSESAWLKEYNRKKYPDLYTEAKTALDEALKPIDEIIQSVEGRSSARTLKAWEIIEAIKRLEHELGIAKKDMIGIKASVDINAQTFPNAYKYTPMSTVFCIERRKSGWFVTNILRAECRKHRYNVTLTDEAKKAIVDKYARF